MITRARKVDGGYKLADLPEGADVDAFLRAALTSKSSIISVTPRRESLEDLFVREAGKVGEVGSTSTPDKGAA